MVTPDMDCGLGDARTICKRCKGTNCTASPFRDLPYGAICRNPEHECPDCVDGWTPPDSEVTP